jgi:CHASE2 domain-containing sensor protein
VLRALPVVVGVWLLTLLFAHLGILHKLEPAVMDAQMRLTKPPADSSVAIVSIDDDDYKNLFHGQSPLDPLQLGALIGAIAAGDPAVIVIDIDTSDARFKQLTIDESEDLTPEKKPQFVWHLEVRSLPENVSSGELDPLPVLGGKLLDGARNSSGLGLLIEDPEDHVTRRYKRLLATTQGHLPSLPWAAVKRFHESSNQHHAESTDDLVIAYSGDREGSHRVKLTAAKTRELAKNWPTASPIKDKIVVLGGSYLGQDRHETPLGTLTGADILANVIETETEHGGGHPAPGTPTMLVLQLFEALGLIVLFHALPFRRALLWSLLAIPVLAVGCSVIAYGSLSQTFHFLPILVGLVIFEVYEHVRRTALPRAYDELRGTDSGAHH